MPPGVVLDRASPTDELQGNVVRSAGSSMGFTSDMPSKTFGDPAPRRRARAARRYRPEKVDLLLVAEAPPSALDRYFYFEDVSEQDSLFR
jgi:hypothetical protein